MILRTPSRVLLAVALAACLAHVARAQDPSEFERVLVPISVGNVPGAYGTVWSTELWYRNNGTTPVAMFPLAISDFVPAVGDTELLPIGHSLAHAPGRILLVSRVGADDVQYDLRLFNRANSGANWGVKLPVVRERQFRTTASLINVPTGAEFRSALRIYGLPSNFVDFADEEAVHVSIYSHDERLLVSIEVLLQGWPLYAQVLSLADSFPEIREVDRVRVHVEARDPQAKIWAFVSAVSNASQEVAVITPD